MMISRAIEIIDEDLFNKLNPTDSSKYKTSELSDFIPSAKYTLGSIESGHDSFSVSEGINTALGYFDIKNNKTIKLVNSNDTGVLNTGVNKVVKLANFGTSFKTIVEFCNDYSPPTTSNPNPTDPTLDPEAPPQTVYLFTGVNPDTYLVENWYDTNLNSKGPNGKIYIHVGLVDTDSEIL